MIAVTSWNMEIEADGTRRFSKPSPRRSGATIVKHIGPALRLEGLPPYFEFARGIAEEHCIEVIEWTSSHDAGDALLGFGVRAVRVPPLNTAVAAYVFAHEAAHHVLGHKHTSPVWRSEIEADTWALRMLNESGLLDDEVQAEAHRHLATRLAHSLRSSSEPEVLTAKIAKLLRVARA